MDSIDELVGEHEDIYARFVDEAMEAGGAKFPPYITETFAKYHTTMLRILRGPVVDSRSDKVKEAEGGLDIALKTFWDDFKATPGNSMIEDIKSIFPTRPAYEGATSHIMQAYDVASQKLSKSGAMAEFSDAYRALNKARTEARKKMADHIYGAEAEEQIETTDDLTPLLDRYKIEYAFFVNEGNGFVQKAKGELNDYLKEPGKTAIFGRRTPKNSAFYKEAITSILGKDLQVSREHGRFEIATEDTEKYKKGDLLYRDTSAYRARVVDANGEQMHINREDHEDKTEVIRVLGPKDFNRGKGSPGISILDKYAIQLYIKKAA